VTVPSHPPIPPLPPGCEGVVFQALDAAKAIGQALASVQSIRNNVAALASSSPALRYVADVVGAHAHEAEELSHTTTALLIRLDALLKAAAGR
jgi:hypothetical protein